MHVCALLILTAGIGIVSAAETAAVSVPESLSAADVRVSLRITEVADTGILLVPVEQELFETLPADLIVRHGSDTVASQCVVLPNPKTNQKQITNQNQIANQTSITSQNPQTGADAECLLVLQLTDVQIQQVRTAGLTLDVTPVYPTGEQCGTSIPKNLSDNTPESVTVVTDQCTITHSKSVQGGLPKVIEFPSGRKLQSHTWHDRLISFDSSPDKAEYRGAWTPASDGRATVQILADGPIFTVVRNTAPFVQSAGTSTNSPAANKTTPNLAYCVYDWLYFKKSNGLGYVHARYYQQVPFSWRERHFFELHIPDGSFPQWSGVSRNDDTQPGSGTFTGTKKEQRYDKWSAFVTPSGDYIALLNQTGMIYDGLHTYGPYLHADPNFAWTGWENTYSENATWFKMGTVDGSNPDSLAEDLNRSSEALEQGFALWTATVPGDSSAAWQATVRRWRQRIERSGREALLLESSGLAMLLSIAQNSTDQNNTDTNSTDQNNTDQNGAEISAIIDKQTGIVLSGASCSLFELKTRIGQTVQIRPSNSGWKSVSHRIINEGTVTELVFESAEAESAGSKTAGSESAVSCRVRLVFQTDSARPGIRLRYETQLTGCEEESLTIGQTCVADQGPGSWCVYPATCGQLVSRPCKSRVSYSAAYPGGWCVMPWAAAWNSQLKTGLYMAVHDSQGGNKTVSVNHQPGTDVLDCRFTIPGSSPLPKGLSNAEIVWQAFSGNWFDAALIYRHWVRQNADWFPQLGREGRCDTPDWMKQLCIWAIGGDEPSRFVEQIRRFRDTFGVPVAVHWYNWHKIPFDNDYPHYFPTRDGFAEAVDQMQKDGDIFVMPYINGRLWDTRDQGLDDWQFTSTALPGVCKNRNGEIITESYGSTETDGSKVKLGVMCPQSTVWQNKVHQNVTTLMKEYGLKGVYVDQVAAAQPVSCFDPSHGHPLGAGCWWVKSYRQMCDRIYGDYPADRMMTTECNAETFTDQFDGLLTWHVQSNNMVPAFSAVYGGAVQMFGRADGGDPTALKMKWAQQLVFGEQIGWFSPGFINEPAKMNYLRPLVRFRNQVVPYFYRGEMARPAQFTQPLPEVTGDWKWGGKSIVTMPVVQTGSWRILNYSYKPAAAESETRRGTPNRYRAAVKDGIRQWETGVVESVLLIFTNFSDKTVESGIDCRWLELGLTPENCVIERIDSEGSRTTMAPEELKQPMTFPAGQTWGIELRTKAVSP